MKQEIKKIFILVVSLLGSTFTLYVQSLRLDEAQSIWVATKSIHEILKFTAEDVHVPLYFITLHFWLQVFGTSVAMARTLSLIFFLMSFFGLYALALKLGDRNVTLLAMMLFSLSPFLVWYSTETRMYTLFVLVTIINNIFFLRFLQSNGANGKLGLLLSNVFGFYTHYFFTLLVAAQGIFLIVKAVSSLLQKKTERLRRTLLLFAALVGGALVFFVPWLWYVKRLGFAAYTQPLISPPTSYNLFQAFFNFIFGFQPQGVQSVLVSFWPLLGMMVLLIFTQRMSNRPNNLSYMLAATFLPITIAFLVSFIRPIFLPRYLIFVTPTFFITIAWVIMVFAKKIFLPALIAAVLLLIALLLHQNLSSYSPIREDYKSVSLYLSGKVTAKDIITVSAPFTIYPIEYYYYGKARIATIPLWDRYETGGIPSFSKKNMEKQINQYKKQYSRVFVVLSYDQGYEDNIQAYFDKNYMLLSVEKFSPGLQIREYRLRYDIPLPK